MPADYPSQGDFYLLNNAGPSVPIPIRNVRHKPIIGTRETFSLIGNGHYIRSVIDRNLKTALVEMRPLPVNVDEPDLSQSPIESYELRLE